MILESDTEVSLVNMAIDDILNDKPMEPGDKELMQTIFGKAAAAYINRKDRNLQEGYHE